MGTTIKEDKIRHFKKMEILKHYKLLGKFRIMNSQEQDEIADIMDVLWDEHNLFDTRQITRVLNEIRKRLCA